MKNIVIKHVKNTPLYTTKNLTICEKIKQKSKKKKSKKIIIVKPYKFVFIIFYSKTTTL